jgi:transcriptional regulator with XRE-family HTH domain
MKNGYLGERDVRLAGSRFPSSDRGAGGEWAAAGRDEQIGKIFRNMRTALKISRDALARRLATSPEVIDSFEAGAVSALPHWKETERIVRSYCDLIRFDPEPVLWRLRGQLQAAANYARAAPQPSSQRHLQHAAARQQSADASAMRATGRRRRRARTLFVLSTPIVLAAGLLYLGQSASRPVYQAIALLPVPIAGPVRSGFDYLVGLTMPSRDGLTWIEVSDPRSRKVDKLPSRAQ